MRIVITALALMSLGLAGCGRLGDVGQAPDFTPVQASTEATAMSTFGMGEAIPAASRGGATPSLWSGNRPVLCWGATGARCSAEIS